MTKEQYKEVVDLAKKAERLQEVLTEIVDPSTFLVFATKSSGQNLYVRERLLTSDMKKKLDQAHKKIIDDIKSELEIIEQRISEI